MTGTPRVLLMTLSLVLSAASVHSAAAATLITPSVGSPAASPSPGSGSATDPTISNPNKIVNPPTASGDLKTQKVLNSLIKQAGWFPNVTVTVQEGMVTIRGTAKDSEQVDWLAKTADRLPGVIAVINQTQIEVPAVSDLTPAWQEFHLLVNQAKKALPLAILAFLLLVILILSGGMISRLVKKIWSRHINNPFLLSTVSKLTMLPVWAIFFYIVLKTAGLSSLATTIIGGTGAASLVIGFAFNGIAQNYLSGLLLAIRSPFTKGDEIEVSTYAGFVQSLNMRGTTIIDYDGNVVLIPNSIVIQSVIRNKTTNSTIRASFNITISYGDPLNKAIELISAILKNTSEVLPKPGFGVAIDKLSNSGIDLTITYWFDTSKSDGGKIKNALVGRIKDELLANGLHIPDSAREVIFSDALKVHMLQSDEEADATESKRKESIKEKAITQLRSEPSKSAADGNLVSNDVRALAEDKTILKKSVDSDLLQAN